MDNYIIKKILNNNVVIAEKQQEEVIIIGKAIGFDLKKGSTIPKDRINSIFIKAPESDKQYNKILNSIDKSIIGISEEIICLCEKKLEIKLNKAIHISLPDHINFAITRLNENIKIQNPFLKDLTLLYPKEYALASEAVNMINTRFNINFPEDEIGFICLHINASIHSKNVADSISYTRKIEEIMDLIRKLLNKDLNKESIEYTRTITHIKFMIDRILNKKSIKNLLLDSIKKELYNEYNIGIKIAIKIENLFSVKVPEDEIGYIALHLKRLSEV